MNYLVIFDLDQTMVDTRSLESLRRSRNWSMVYSSFDQTVLFDGIRHLIDRLDEVGINKAIVTSSPSVYASRLLEFHGLSFNNIVGYHDTYRRKPSPDPVLKAIENSQIRGDLKVLGLGDNLNDLRAYYSARITPVACLWGWSEEVDPPEICPRLENPMQLFEILEV